MGFGIQRYDSVRFYRPSFEPQSLFSPHLNPMLFRFLKAAVEARYRVRTMIRGEGWQYRLGSSLHNITETENAGVRSLQNVKFTLRNAVRKF
jgi:hypothetical protein